jgi:hypothetical protein
MEGVGTRAFKPPLQLERAETMGRIGIRRRDRGNLFADFYNKICQQLTCRRLLDQLRGCRLTPYCIVSWHPHGHDPETEPWPTEKTVALAVV